MIVTKEELARLIQSEIDWCLDNPSKELNQDQQMGFMNGLRQAQMLIDLTDGHVHQWVKDHNSPTDYRCSRCYRVRPASLMWGGHYE
jgi:hypothetical protein